MKAAVGQGAAIVFVVLGLVAILTIEIWLYGMVYLSLGALPDFESALYFSTTSFTTIGYGDVVLEQELAPVRRDRGRQWPAVVRLVDRLPDRRHGPHAHPRARLARAPGRPHMIAIAIESPLQDDVRTARRRTERDLLELTPPEFVFHMTAEQMAGSRHHRVHRPRRRRRRWRAARSSATPTASARSSACTRGPRIAAARSARMIVERIEALARAKA